MGRWVSQVAAWLVIFGVASVLAAAVVVPRLAGATPYTVLTGSMRPHYAPGTLVVVRPVQPGGLGIGDVVTYQLESGEPTVVTHRVVGITTRLDGKITYTTQGDANDRPDEQPVRPVQVRGRLWYAVPYLGYASELLTGGQRQTAVTGVAAALLLYAVVMLVGGVRDRSRREVSA